MTVTTAFSAHLASVRRDLMTGVSFMIPFVTIGGVFLAAAHTVGGEGALEQPGTLAWFLAEIGRVGLAFVAPVLGAYVAYGIADRPGLAPGFVLTALVQQGAVVEQAGRIVGIETGQTGAGYLGAIGVGLLAGAAAARLAGLNLPGAVEPLVPVLLLPVVVTGLCAPVVLFLLAPPLALANERLIAFSRNVVGFEAIALGAILGAMMAIDSGGPVNKIAYVFGVTLIPHQIYAPMAAVMIAGMVPPLGLALSNVVAPHKYPEDRSETARAAVPMGLSFVTEGVLPYATADPVRVVPSIVIGSATAAATAMWLGVRMPAPHGGVLVVFLANNWTLFLACVALGTALTAAIVTFLKPAYDENTAATETVRKSD
ncbi:PTS fructose transporter subunit IIC [Halosolutus halophilus]|uniref:PTS fructose transporter subunit IIC n=1 Tax=Halosolutus halophilus TaxID=1552990 RepID=UPI0022351371|nr:PTS fructose transporter subunit IIC [Halosolutus halophilus]